jgi:nitrogen fixation protein
MKYEYNWSSCHNGVMLCDFEKTKELMPEVAPLIDDLISSGQLEEAPENYLVDVKIHMLIQGMYPCIPSWHRDFQPRNCNGKREKTVKCNRKMYMWISGAPSTEYKNDLGETYKKEPQTWSSFTRQDLHRGTKCELKNTWRCLIRVIPKDFVHDITINAGQIRRHTQVYLPETYSW